MSQEGVAGTGAMGSTGRDELVEATIGQIRKVFAKTITDYGSSTARTQLPMLPHMALHATLPKGGATQRQMAEFLGVSSGYVTGLVDRLEAAGFAERKRDANDRRVVHVTATSRGQQMHDRVHAESQRRISTAFDAWSDAEIRTFQQFLARLEAAHQRSPVVPTTRLHRRKPDP